MEVRYLLGPLSDSSRQHFGTLSGTPSCDVEFDIEDDHEHKNKVIFVFNVPNLTFERVLREI